MMEWEADRHQWPTEQNQLSFELLYYQLTGLQVSSIIAPFHVQLFMHVHFVSYCSSGFVYAY
jgi:hypothetical protein